MFQEFGTEGINGDTSGPIYSPFMPQAEAKGRLMRPFAC